MFRFGWFRQLAAWLVAAVVGIGLNTVAAGAEPVVLGCGAVVTTSVQLAADIGPCQDHGIIVGADDITVDLNGHQIFGLGGLVVTHQASGVFSDNHRGVVVTNGTIHDMYHGVRIRQGSNNLVTRITARNNAGGNGIVFETSADNVASFNFVYANSGFAGMATFNTNALPGQTAARNTFTDNVVYLNNAHGISIENGPGHIVRRNQVNSNTRDGISLFAAAPGVLVEANNVIGNGSNGINVRSNGNVVRGNQAARNGGRGIQVSGQSNLIANNSASGNALDLLDANANCDANVWFGNRFGTASPECTRR